LAQSSLDHCCERSQRRRAPQLDWRFEGPAALFLLAKAKGCFAAEKLDVTIDAGNGSGNAVNRVASGSDRMGFADLVGRKMGAPVFDAGRRAFPIFARANGIDVAKVNWTAMDPPLRETMLAKGDVDAISGFYCTSLLNLNARGVMDEDIVVLPHPKYGVKLYGNAIFSTAFLPTRVERMVYPK
jgi:NitT/TauT family transport system substrate-binding protein